MAHSNSFGGYTPLIANDAHDGHGNTSIQNDAGPQAAGSKSASCSRGDSDAPVVLDQARGWAVRNSKGVQYVRLVVDDDPNKPATAGPQPPRSPGSTDTAVRFARQRQTSAFLINLVSIMERMDEQVLPAVSRYLGCSFRATPHQLGNITFCRAVVQALASPIGGFVGHYYNRILVLFLGASIWALFTFAFSFSETVQQGMFFWAFNGIGLSLIIPNSQSLIADYYAAEHRGGAFGALQLTSSLGGMLGSLYATNIGGLRIFGAEGWRFAFMSVGCVSLSIAVLVLAFGSDPRCRGRELRPAFHHEGHDDSKSGPREWIAHIKQVITVPSFIVIIVQGIIGTTPSNALVFTTLYLQLLGMSDFAASILLAIYLLGLALGGLLGGWIGDAAARRLPNSGRIIVAQVSAFVGVPLSVLLLKGLPLNGSPGAAVLYGLVLLTHGLLTAWPAPACNNPIFAEIVPPELRNMVYAFDRSFEGSLAALGAPLVGIFAERVFGFKGIASGSGCETRGGVPDSDSLRKAVALGNAMLFWLVVPWTLCTLFFSGLYWTYPRDRRRAMEAAPGEMGAGVAVMQHGMPLH